MERQQRGTVSLWKDDKGYGFITPDGGGEDVFFHIGQVVGRRAGRPAPQMVVYYTLGQDEQRRLRALNVHLESEPLGPVVLALLMVCIFFGILAALIIAGMLPSWAPMVYIALSVYTYILYSSDKARAVTGARRIPEARLHRLELLGGWPGALIAQSYFRHKNRKGSYQFAYWSMVTLNLVLLAGAGALWRWLSA